jgi:hypothetical protein
MRTNARVVRSRSPMLSARVVLVASLGLWSCARPVAPPPVAHGEPVASRTDATSEPGEPAKPAEAPGAAQIEQDIHLAVGGNFSPDHLGPEAFEAIERRMAAAPAAYARKVGELYGRSPPPPELPHLHTTALLVRLHAGAPAETSASAHALLSAFGRLVATLDRGSPARARALEQMPMLEALAGGIDPPFDAAAPSMKIDRLCAVPTPTGHGLMVVNECTCGERPVCRAELDGSRVTVSVRRDDSRAPFCTDCYPSWSTCSLPKLRSKQRVSIVLDGRSFGELTAGPTGWLTPGVCLSRP